MPYTYIYVDESGKLFDPDEKCYCTIAVIVEQESAGYFTPFKDVCRPVIGYYRSIGKKIKELCGKDFPSPQLKEALQLILQYCNSSNTTFYYAHDHICPLSYARSIGSHTYRGKVRREIEFFDEKGVLEGR